MNDQDEEPGDTSVFLWNMSEDVWPFISSISNTKDQQNEIRENDLYSDREVYTLPSIDADIYVTPVGIDPEFSAWSSSILQQKPRVNWVPDKSTGSLCEDVLQDSALLKKILAAGKKTGRLTLRSYSSSPQFLELVLYLRKKGIHVETPESPQPLSHWTVDHFGSKSGIRQAVQRHYLTNTSLRMIDGIICLSVHEAVCMAAWTYQQYGGVVIKTNKGHSGAGVLIYGPDTLPHSLDECRNQLSSVLSTESYWERFPIIVEHYISFDKSVGGGNPNVEFRITSAGEVEYMYSCGMRINTKGIFQGVEIGNIHLPKSEEKQMIECGHILGNVYKTAGYCGYFDADFMYSTDKHLYLAESNVRRTGGTYVYALATHLFGKQGFLKKYFASNIVTVPGKNPTFTSIRRQLSDVLYTPEKKEGIVIMSANALELNKLMYVVVGDNKKKAENLEEKMNTLLFH